MIRTLRVGHDAARRARKRPEGDALLELAAALEARIDRAAALNPNPGFRPFQRANRAEYARAVRDLLGIDVDVNAFLPPDTISNGFDNVADAQTLSPTLMEGYLRAASQISRLAVGDRTATADIGHLQDSTRAVADGARRRRADRHARRRLRGPHLPGRRRIHLQGGDALRAARRADRPRDDEHVRPERAD